MNLKIENDETDKLVPEISAITGESSRDAVTVALRERLARLRQEGGDSLAEMLLAIGRECAARLREPIRSVDHADLLYDEHGRPR